MICWEQNGLQPQLKLSNYFIKWMNLFGIVLYCFCLKDESMFKQGPIIIVEDDFDDQELLKEIFEELNIPNIIKFFNSCVQAFEYLLTTIEKPFLIISDINLPAMNGLDLCKKIMEHKDLKTKSIPFVFLTTTHDHGVITKAYEMYVQGFFVKPSSIKELKEMIRMIVGYWSVCRHPYIQ
jgi:CheY-like chemotaxis protein